MSTFDAEVVAEFVGGEGGEHFFLRRRGPIGKDMWGVGVILSVSVRLLVFIVQN